MLNNLTAISAKEKKLEVDVERFLDEVQALKFDLKKEQGQHADTLFKSQKLMRQLNTLKWQFFELTEERKRLLEDRVGVKQENEELRKFVTILKG